MTEFKFSKSYQAKKARIKRLPKLVEASADTFSKKDAVALIDTFREGIKDNSFGLVALQATTIARKKREGKEKPEVPLYGKGESEDASYINMFKIRKLKNGYRVYPRWIKHHGSGLPLRVMLDIHEHGALIKKANGTIIRIPPRPTFGKAFRRHLNSRRRAENTQEVRDAIMALIKNSDDSKFKAIIAKTKETDKHDET